MAGNCKWSVDEPFARFVEELLSVVAANLEERRRGGRGRVGRGGGLRSNTADKRYATATLGDDGDAYGRGGSTALVIVK